MEARHNSHILTVNGHRKFLEADIYLIVRLFYSLVPAVAVHEQDQNVRVLA